MGNFNLNALLPGAQSSRVPSPYLQKVHASGAGGQPSTIPIRHELHADRRVEALEAQERRSGTRRHELEKLSLLLHVERPNRVPEPLQMITRTTIMLHQYVMPCN